LPTAVQEAASDPHEITSLDPISDYQRRQNDVFFQLAAKAISTSDVGRPCRPAATDLILRHTVGSAVAPKPDVRTTFQLHSASLKRQVRTETDKDCTSRSLAPTLDAARMLESFDHESSENNAHYIR
jgi:hypothetical protein